MSCTLGLWGSADGRGILFEREPPVVMNELQSFLSGELTVATERVILESTPLTGRIECIPALGRLSNVHLRMGYRFSPDGS